MAKKQSLEKKKQMKNQSMQRKADRQQEERVILHRCLALLAVLAVAEVYFLVCYRFFVNGTMQSLVAWADIIGVVNWAALGVALFGVILGFVCRSKPIGKLGFYLDLLGLLVFFGGSLMLSIYPMGTTVACVAMPLFALAGLVYYLYQREFFYAGLGVGLAVVGMWLARKAVGSASWSGKYMVVEIVFLVVIAVLLVLAVMIGRNGGKWKKGEQARQVFSGSTNYAMVYGSLVAAAAAILVGMFAPAAALYLMWIGIAWLFVLAVYYTVHMM